MQGAVKWFDSLFRRDFDNGAVLDSIRSALAEAEKLTLDRDRHGVICEEWIKRARSAALEIRTCNAGPHCEECLNRAAWIDTYSLEELEADMELAGKLEPV